MKKRYNETTIELAGVSCVAYLVKVKNRHGTEYFVPKISPNYDIPVWKVKK